MDRTTCGTKSARTERRQPLTARSFPELLDPARARDAWGVWTWNDAALDRLVEGVDKARRLIK